MRATVLTIFTTLTLLILQILASIFSWYEKFAFFDVIMHFLGGLWATSFITYIASRYQGFYFLREKNIINFVNMVALVLFLGVLWEFFEFGLEYFSGHLFTLSQRDYYTDTLSDIFFDMVGAIFGTLFAK